MTGTPSLIDKSSLPEFFPTHMHQPEFWEHLGRTVATFGFLEEVLGKAIFALTATRPHDVPVTEREYAAWLPKLERALHDPLNNLIDVYAKSAREHRDFTTTNFEELVLHLREAAVLRNVLCHGSWGVPDETGKSLPLYMSRQMMLFETSIDVAFLKQLQQRTAELACEVVSTITHMGWQFPGAAGPGKPIWNAK